MLLSNSSLNNRSKVKYKILPIIASVKTVAIFDVINDPIITTTINIITEDNR